MSTRITPLGLTIAMLLAVGSLFLIAGGVGATTVLFTDNFNDGNDTGWTQFNRCWHVIDGRYHLDGGYNCDSVPLTGERDGFSYTHVDDPTWIDYTFEFTFDTTNAQGANNPQWGGTSDTHHAMVFFRVQGLAEQPHRWGAPTQYRVGFLSGGQCCHAERVQLDKYANGGAGTLANVSLSGVILLGTNSGKVVVTGGHIQVFVNNQLVVDFTDPDPILFGGIGLGAVWEVNAWFDDIIVTSNVEEEDVTLSTTGIEARTVVCWNLTKRRFVAVNPASGPPWDCEAAGLVVETGDRILINVLGTAD